MRYRVCLYGAAAGSLLVLGCNGAPASEPTPTPLRLGVTAHFAQGWPEPLWHSLASVRAETVREALGWRRVETSTGRYVFTAQNSGHLARLCAMKMPVVLVIEPRNPLYDNGDTVDSPGAQAAFGTFVAAVKEHFGSCLTAIEIGNEINGAKAMTGAAASNRAASHVRLMKAVWQAVKPRSADVALLGGSVNTIGTGFLESLFAQGLLEWVDGIAIHPYRRTPEGLTWELAALNDAMARHGGIKPLWATEFGLADADARSTSDYLLKMAVLFSASGIREAQWYALADDTAFPTMGLVRSDATAKPAAATFSYLAANLLSNASAMRLSGDEPALQHFRFDREYQVLWGASRSVSVPDAAVVSDSHGQRLHGPLRISDTPLIIKNPGEVQLGPAEVLADSLYDYAQPEWIYLASAAAKASFKLRLINSNFASTLGEPKLGPVAVNPLGMVLPAQKAAVSATMRFVVRNPAALVAQACLVRRTPGKGSVAFAFETRRAGHVDHAVKPQGLSVSQSIDAKAGDTIDFRTTAQGGAAVLAYRFRIALAGTIAAREPLQCN